MRSENVNVANEAALLMIDILKEPRKSFLSLNQFRGNTFTSKEGPCCQIYVRILKD